MDDVEVDFFVGGRRAVKNAFEPGPRLLEIIDRHNDPQSVKAAGCPVDGRSRNNCRECLLGAPVGAFDLENVDEESTADVDSSDPGVVFLGELGVGALDPLEDLVGTSTPEGRPDEGT